MISLSELFHSVSKEKSDGLINIDDWRYPDVDHLVSMGFEFDGDFKLRTNKTPEITIYKKEEDENGEKVEVFYVEEKNRKVKRFKAFNDVIDYFDAYEQPILDKNR